MILRACIRADYQTIKAPDPMLRNLQPSVLGPKFLHNFRATILPSIHYFRQTAR